MINKRFCHLCGFPTLPYHPHSGSLLQTYCLNQQCCHYDEFKNNSFSFINDKLITMTYSFTNNMSCLVHYNDKIIHIYYGPSGYLMKVMIVPIIDFNSIEELKSIIDTLILFK